MYLSILLYRNLFLIFETVVQVIYRFIELYIRLWLVRLQHRMNFYFRYIIRKKRKRKTSLVAKFSIPLYGAYGESKLARHIWSVSNGLINLIEQWRIELFLFKYIHQTFQIEINFLYLTSIKIFMSPFHLRFILYLNDKYKCVK